MPKTADFSAILGARVAIYIIYNKLALCLKCQWLNFYAPTNLHKLKIHSVRLGPRGIIAVLHPSPIIPLPGNDRKHAVTMSKYRGDSYF